MFLIRAKSFRYYILVWIFAFCGQAWTMQGEVTMPQPDPSGFVQTLNQMGYMTSSLDPFSREFVQYAATVQDQVLEIGAAYGVATLEALKLGATIIANDLDERHLEVLRNRAPESLRTNLSLLPGRFPTDLEITSESISAILISRVLHFFDGPTLIASAAELFRYLKPGGKLFIVADTPYLKPFESFLPTYFERKARQIPWPGFIENLRDRVTHRAGQLPDFFHALDPEVLSQLLENAGFKIEKVEIFSQSQYPLDIQLDGREGVGCIAVKPGSPN